MFLDSEAAKNKKDAAAKKMKNKKTGNQKNTGGTRLLRNLIQAHGDHHEKMVVLGKKHGDGLFKTQKE